MRTLSHQEAKAFYDRFGARQHSQAFYEGATAAMTLAATAAVCGL